MQNENKIESVLVSFRGNKGSNGAWDVLKIFVLVSFVTVFKTNASQFRLSFFFLFLNFLKKGVL